MQSQKTVSAYLMQVSRYCILALQSRLFVGQIPANTARWNNDVLMLAQRLRRRPNIKTSLFHRVVFAGKRPFFHNTVAAMPTQKAVSAYTL